MNAWLAQQSWTDLLWLALGFGAQGMFFMRFVVQWITSERRRESVIPISFWYFSLAGASLLLVYAIHQQDPVFILGQSLGAVIYTRNLLLIRRARLPRTAGN